MREFLLGVVSSLAASALILVGGAFSSRTLRRWLVLALSRVTGIGVERSYSTQREANRDLPGDLAHARWVWVLAGRGNELTRDSFQTVWHDADARLESVKILLPDPNCGNDTWLAKREAENARHDRGYGGKLLGEQVRANIAYVLNIASDSANIALRLYDLPNLCRVIATDRVAYMTMYSPGAHGRNSPCLVFRNPSPMYDFALRIFTLTWSTAGIPQTDEDRDSR
jgi:hypothetical protein